MQLETLRLYCDIVRLQSFSRGAQQGAVSQSAASQAVQQLERELGVALIDRTKRPLAVTAEGQAFYASCRALLEAWEKAKAEVAAVKAEVDGTVRVAAIYSVGLHDMSHPIQRFLSLHPSARVELECLHPHKVVEAVVSGEADVGVLSYPRPDRALSVVPLRDEPMAFVCHPGHRLARRSIVLPADLNGERFVAFDPELRIRRAIDRTFRQYGVKVTTVMEFDNIETIKQAIMIAAGVSILPRHTVRKEAGIRTLAVVPVGMQGLVRPVGLIHRRRKPQTPTVARFVQVLRELMVQGEEAPETRRRRVAGRRSEETVAGTGITGR